MVPSDVLQRLCAKRFEVFHQRDVAPPGAEHGNRWGRFVCRAHWLDTERAGDGALIGVSVRHLKPAALVLTRRMQAAGLSAREQDVALGLAQGLSFAAIAADLHIRRTTAKDYAQRRYRKLDMHPREGLPQLLC